MVTRGSRTGRPWAQATGVCPVCGTEQRLSVGTGKILYHGKTRERPGGCAGRGQWPQRGDRPGTGTVVGWSAGDASPDPSARPAPRAGEPGE